MNQTYAFFFVEYIYVSNKQKTKKQKQKNKKMINWTKYYKNLYFFSRCMYHKTVSKYF